MLCYRDAYIWKQNFFSQNNYCLYFAASTSEAFSVGGLVFGVGVAWYSITVTAVLKTHTTFCTLLFCIGCLVCDTLTPRGHVALTALFNLIAASEERNMISLSLLLWWAFGLVPSFPRPCPCLNVATRMLILLQWDRLYRWFMLNTYLLLWNTAWGNVGYPHSAEIYII